MADIDSRRRDGRGKPLLIFAASMMLTSNAQAQDWTATMPAVPAVLQAVDKYMQTREFTGRYKGDPDFVASAQLGTLRSMRRIMVDATGINDLARMPPTMRAQTERYLWAELAVVLRVRSRLAKGDGWITRSCRDPGSNYRRSFPRESPDRCLLSLVYQNSGSYEASYQYHQEIWPELFPAATATRYVELIRAKARTTPVLTQVLRFTGEAPALPRGVGAPGFAECSDWKTYALGTELCRLVAKPATCKYTVKGPYGNPDLAIRAIEPDIRKATNDFNASLQGRVYNEYAEMGGWVVHRRGASMNTEYYLTVPVRGAKGMSDINTTGEDFQRSLLASFTGDCDFYATFDLVAMYHSHPDFTDVVNRKLQDNNEFSANDWAAAHDMFQRKAMRTPADEAPPESPADIKFRIGALRNFLGLYLLRPDRCIDFIDGSSAKADSRKVVPIDAQACPLSRRGR